MLQRTTDRLAVVDHHALLFTADAELRIHDQPRLKGPRLGGGVLHMDDEQVLTVGCGRWLRQAGDGERLFEDLQPGAVR